ncbi:MFS transporter [Microbacterium kyungheense]|uniref:Putative MFS family arabinose efflux permease n=1 Tax=Microbacterium kyungheense TaxID=1263636 RepID=A0A543EAC7_9MICO|nr:MFS transporter [Microbacterium kyungheense]TQM18534.1 putative MFS family arabinose efflux permease [Microbacterium kyungheense]
MSQSDELRATDAAGELGPEALAEARAEATTLTSRAGADEAVQADQDAATAGPAVTPAPKGSLWRDRNFMTLWSGQALSQFGAQITELAIPVLAVLALNATEWEVGVLNAAQVAAFLIVGLPAGAWIDRMRKRHVMMVADAVRAVALATLPVLAMLGVLQIWHMIVVALVMGVATVFFDVSNQSIVPSLVRTNQIAEANGKLQSTEQLANLAGPAAGGWLIGVLAAPLAIFITVGTYLASFVALTFTRDHEKLRAPEDHKPLLHEIGEGLRWVFGNPLLRRIVLTTGTANFFSTISMTLLPIFVLRELGLTPQMLGVVFSLSAVGGLLGAIATPKIVARIGEARAIPLSAIAFSVVPFFLPAISLVPALAFPLLVAQFFLGSFTVLLYNITQVTFRQRITPPRLLGRMNASVRFVVWGVMPIGALLAGALGTWIGTVPTLWIAATFELFACLFVVIGPFWTMRDLPDAHAEHADGATG